MIRNQTLKFAPFLTITTKFRLCWNITLNHKNCPYPLMVLIIILLFFEYWYHDIELTGEDLYILQKNSKVLQRISENCEDYSLLKKFLTTGDNSIISEFYLYSCKQFSGKIRKLPTLLF